MVKKTDDAEVAKAEQQLRKAQNARKRAQQAERKPFLDEIKEKAKVVQARIKAKRIAEEKAEAKVKAALQAYKKKVRRLIIKGIQKHVKLQN